MNYVLVSPEQLILIQQINVEQLDSHNQLKPIQLKDNRYILNANILTDLKTWDAWSSVLAQLVPTTVTSSDFIVPDTSTLTKNT